MKPSIASPFFSSAWVLGSCAALVLAACDPADPSALDDLADSEAIDDADEEANASTGEVDEPLNVELEALVDDVDPQEVFAGWVGGNGGSQYTAGCPYAYTAIGLAVAPSIDGTLVRQLALVCAIEAEVEAGHAIPIGQQSVIASGYSNSGYLVAPSQNSRLVWDASESNPIPWQRYKAPSTSYHLCDAGYRLNKIDVRAGAYVDRISSYTCWWDGPGGQGPRGLVYPAGVNVGGWGGAVASSSCQTTTEKFVDGIRFRSAAWLDGFAVDCLE